LMVFPSGGDFYIPNFKYNLGAAYIIAFLKNNGFKIEQFISNESYNVKECVKQILKHNPKIVGFTVYDSNFMQCELISKGLKRINTNIIVIFGGPTASVHSKEIMESSVNVDLCVRREGEEILLLLLTTLSKNNFNLIETDLENIKGITFRKRQLITVNPDSDILLSNRYIENYLDKYPSPYISKIIPTSEAFRTGIITARGCNQNCVYCNSAVISKKNIFFHSIERVIDELAYLSGYDNFKGPLPILDDTFTIMPTRTKKICETIIENNIKIPLSCNTRCDKITEDLLDLMKQAGFVSIGFSLESAVPRILRSIGKVLPPESKKLDNFDKETNFIEKLKTITSYAKKIGMNPVFVSIMVGLPNESIHDAQKTIEFVSQLNVDFYAHNNLHIFKGTPIYHNFKKYGYKIKSIGQKNNILTYNTFPFDINKIKLAPRSATEKKRKVIDYNNFKILSLAPKRKVKRPYFDNIIILSDIIKQSLVRWIQENLMINGNIIHVYSNEQKYKKYYKKNITTLYNEFSPTMYYECYYLENSNDTSILKSERMISLGEQIGFLIKLKNTNLVLRDYKKGYNNVENVICVEHDLNDTEALYHLLIEISKSKNSIEYLLESKPLPQFQNICRWTNNQSNCEKLETVIIGKDDSIHICWHSDPIGKVGATFSDIIQNLQDLQIKKKERRNCDGCIKNRTCIKCLFPYPLSSEEYCQYKRRQETYKPANLINSFEILKDLLFKPINRFDF